MIPLYKKYKHDAIILNRNQQSIMVYTIILRLLYIFHNQNK